MGVWGKYPLFKYYNLHVYFLFSLLFQYKSKKLVFIFFFFSVKSVITKIISSYYAY